jgi:hypothetical protein
MAKASKNPPRKRNITELKYDEAISSPFKTPIKGKSIKGNNEVAASGIASVIHQIAINAATAAVKVTLGFEESRLVKKIMQKKTKSPEIKPILEDKVTLMEFEF